MKTRLIAVGAASAFCMLVAGFGIVAPVRAAASLTGEYRCVRVEARGQSEPCQSPPLKLNRDGSYEIWGEHGTYEVVQGQWLVLSHSKRRGMGRVVNSGEIVFEYRINNASCRVTFQRVYNPPHGMKFS